MRNNFLFIIFLTAIFITGSLNCNSQIIDNKINLSAGYEKGIFNGNESTSEQTFIYPSLYSNYKSLNGIYLKILYNLHNEFLSFGIASTCFKGSDWRSSDSLGYQGSNVILYFLSPVVQIHSGFNELGVFNKIRLFFVIAPNIGISNLKLTNKLFDIRYGNSIISQPKKCNDIFYGFKSNAGIELTINQNVSVSLSCFFSYNRVESKFYADNHFSSIGLSAGTILRLNRIKQLF